MTACAVEAAEADARITSLHLSSSKDRQQQCGDHLLAACAGWAPPASGQAAGVLTKPAWCHSRYRQELAAGGLTKAGGRVTRSGGGGEGLPFLFNDQSVYYLMLTVDEANAHG